ncbi:MAG: Arginine-tRNA ligase, partial [Parcubacteria group bacterium GW2011_GWB1_45_10]
MLISELLKIELKKILETDLSRAESRDEFSVSVSPRLEFGDYTTNAAFILAKQRQQSPFLVAEDIKKDLGQKLGKYFSKIEIKNGYLNFFLSKEFLVETLNKSPQEILKPKNPKKVIVEYSSPNIGKQLSVAHIGSTIIGDALTRIYKFSGHKVITDSHLGDWGMLAGKLIAAYKKYSKTPLTKITIQEMNELYVRFTTLEKEDEKLIESAKQETVKLQKHDKENLKVWRTLLKNSLKEFNKNYKILGTLPFDFQHGESFYQKYSEKVVEDFKKKRWAKQSQGALIVELENLPPVLIQKTDEAFLYATSDLGTIIQRQKAYHPDLVLYVVANEQALHFEQVFAIAKKFKLAPKTELKHVKFGMLLGADHKKLSTRRGKSILLEDVLEEAFTRAKEIAGSKKPGLSAASLKKIFWSVGIGAIKYNYLSQNRQTDIVFDWDKMLSLEGNSSPYIQYSFARLSSILKKSGQKSVKLELKDIEFLSEGEINLLRKLVQFPEVVFEAAFDYLPNLVANYVFELASLANSFYEKYPVLQAKENEKKSRLKLIALAAATIKNS